MSFIEIILLAIGLSMDSLAVSVTSGTLIPKLKATNVIKIASILGLFQALMTLGGYWLGWSFKKYIVSFDHWIAFILLLYLGGKMVYEGFRSHDEESKINPLSIKNLCCLGIATSIDAMAIGVSLACLSSSIAFEASIIGIVTFILSGLGVYLGHHFGRKINMRFELIGGIILIGIGIKILIEHLFFNA